ncbi:MAG: hypothetical protein ABW166_12195 [Sedimenticola sp.]
MGVFNKGDVGVNLDGVHGRIHEGQFFIASEFNQIGNKATLIYLVSTHEKSAHFAFDITTNGDVEVNFYKQVTVSTVGTVIEGLNANDFSTTSALTIITTGATLSDTGTLWECSLSISGPGQSRSSQTLGSRLEEFVLKTNDFYALSIENLNVTTLDLCARIGWYEPQV